MTSLSLLVFVCCFYFCFFIFYLGVVFLYSKKVFKVFFWYEEIVISSISPSKCLDPTLMLVYDIITKYLFLFVEQ